MFISAFSTWAKQSETIWRQSAYSYSLAPEGHAPMQESRSIFPLILLALVVVLNAAFAVYALR